MFPAGIFISIKNGNNQSNRTKNKAYLFMSDFLLETPTHITCSYQAHKNSYPFRLADDLTVWQVYFESIQIEINQATYKVAS